VARRLGSGGSDLTRRRLIVALLVVLALAAGYMLWFRDSSFVAVEKVQVTGADVSPEVVERLTDAGMGLSTLNLDRSKLEAAVADDPTVVALKIDTDFPHGLTIDVQSRTPAGWIDADGGTVVAGDGTVLTTGVDQPDEVPQIEEDADVAGGKVEGPALATARVLGATPAPLQPQVESATVDDAHGVVVTVTGGIELRFGDPANADQKWRAASSVLADPGLGSATYIDLSVPTRPVVG
jgi:cell division septal protein FtsQ